MTFLQVANLVESSYPAASVYAGIQFEAQMWYDGVEQAYCSASNCSIGLNNVPTNGSVEWSCQSSNCKCIAGATFCGGAGAGALNLTDTLSDVTGPLALFCPPSSSSGVTEPNPITSCGLSQVDINLFLKSNLLELVDCSFGECVQQGIIDKANAKKSGAVRAWSGVVLGSGGLLHVGFALGIAVTWIL